MTKQAFADLMESQRVKEKLVNKLIKEYPKYRSEAEDWAARIIVYGLRKASQFNDAIGAMAYVMTFGPKLAQKDIEREKSRQDGLIDPARIRAKYRPNTAGREIHAKVDLEKAIRLTTGEKRMQQALWHIHYEDWTWEEVIAELPVGVPYKTWESRLRVVNNDLTDRLRAYGYRG